MEMTIHERGYWIGVDSTKHLFDLPLARAIVDLAKEFKLYAATDIGCGDGSYTDYLNENSIWCRGFDGNPYTKALTEGRCQVLDFSVPTEISSTELVLCLEVGEHIPKEYEDILIENLVRCTDDILILSWAIPGQGGFGHVNCKSNDDVIDKLRKYNFTYLIDKSNYLRFASMRSWFKNTILIFKNDNN